MLALTLMWLRRAVLPTPYRVNGLDTPSDRVGMVRPARTLTNSRLRAVTIAGPGRNHLMPHPPMVSAILLGTRRISPLRVVTVQLEAPAEIGHALSHASRLIHRSPSWVDTLLSRTLSGEGIRLELIMVGKIRLFSPVPLALR